MKLILILLLILIKSQAYAAPKLINNDSFIYADKVDYHKDENFIIAQGNVRITIDPYVITAETLIYDITKDLLLAKGEVKIIEGQEQVALGEAIIFRDKFKSGIISEFVMKFNIDNAILAAKFAQKHNPNKISLYKSVFTPCTITCNQEPIWKISAKATYVDLDKQKIVYRNLFFEVYGVPILFIPYFSHPTPNAKAQSGVLVPSISKNNFTIPLYYRAKPNLDFTLSPRIANKYTIFEFEGRHKINSGYYEITGSYGRVLYKQKRVGSAHIVSNGIFSTNNYNYGFNINKVTDKAYLKNYQDRYDSYLFSKIFLNKVDDFDYFTVEGQHFQGLKVDSSSDTDPFIYPKIRSKNVIDIGESGITALIVNSDLLRYSEPSGRAMERGSLGLNLSSDVVDTRGHMFGLALRNRSDLYNLHNMYGADRKKNSYIRNIPELQGTWLYPLLKNNINSSIILNPIASITLGRRYRNNRDKSSFIDPKDFEIAENNIFDANRFSGIDNHEFGSRLSYGVNSSLLTRDNYYSLFVAQFLNHYTTLDNEKKGTIGKLTASISNQIELYYRFRLDKIYRPIRDEIGANYITEKMQLDGMLIKLRHLRRKFVYNDNMMTKNRAFQFRGEINYRLFDNWSFGHNIHLDMSTGKTHMIYKTIRVTYHKDCVSIALKLHDNYTKDGIRGIKKVHNKSIILGLKVLNM